MKPLVKNTFNTKDSCFKDTIHQTVEASIDQQAFARYPDYLCKC